ncbi:Endonuclease/exonuclease/phosphatase [Corchorus olitorius]|uniref:Endonuclease/exonuclease/phosphatase n=1 Tax=Corchorus olitorius TaxID=93759 RepID=A0A1R3K1B5_9ROSI|nr:Endonuclease/exonuclease/phosphatase [Corchorus olitorius]
MPLQSSLSLPSAPSSDILSVEESDLLQRSTKRFKDQVNTMDVELAHSEHARPNFSQSPLVESSSHQLVHRTYRDKLVNQADDLQISYTSFSRFLDEDSDLEEEDDQDDTPVILLSKEEKNRLRKPWIHSIIIKTYGKSVGYNYLYPKIMAQWKPKGRMDCIDLGHDFFVVRFHLPADFNAVFYGGPWFVGPHFLSMRLWEPNFDPKKATFSTTAVWARLPGLPIELFDATLLKRIGNQLGTLLRIDAHTVNNLRGWYARICIQVDLDRPLLSRVKIGQHKQKVLYESISGLCFGCGCLGHKISNCPVKNPDNDNKTMDCDDGNGTPLEQAPASANGVQSSEGEEGYGPWMVVSRRRNKQNARSGKDVRKREAASQNPTSNRGSRVGPDKGVGKGPMTSLKASTTEGPKDSTKPKDSNPSLGLGESSGTTEQGATVINAVGHSRPVKTPQSRDSETDTPRPQDSVATLPSTLAPTSPNPKIESNLGRQIAEALTNLGKNKANPPNPKYGADGGKRGAGTSLPPRGQDLVRIRDSKVPVPPKLDDPDGVRSDSGQPGVAQTRRSDQHHQDRRLSPSPDPITNGSNGQRVVQGGNESNAGRASEGRVSRGKRGSRSRSRGPKSRALGNQNDEKEYNLAILPHHHEEANMLWKMADGTVIAAPEIAQWWLGDKKPSNSMLKILVWNCRGAANDLFRRAFRDLVRDHKPAICFLSETRVSGEVASRIVASLGFGGSHIINAQGFSGGLWMLWDPEKVDINILPHGEQAINAVAKLLSIICPVTTLTTTPCFWTSIPELGRWLINLSDLRPVGSPTLILGLLWMVFGSVNKTPW